ncbi:MAG: indolepyruvate ferredoxin oxidoreductase subunit alpha [Fibrobacteres bacterium]|nr:indolepyruvate ferredoxin oxidoreductase subunit alpha [Fibrobacterota bacterium]
MKTSNTQKLFLSGNEALARGAWEAGLKVAAAYPGTPSTEILENIGTYAEIDAQWSVNEKVAYEVAYGASMAGVRSLYASKHVGLNVAMDPLMTSVYMGVNGGFVAVVADDPGLHSSQNEQDTRWTGIYGKLPVMEPCSPQETYDFIKEAFVISEKFDTPVLFRITTRTAHAKEDVTVASRVEIQDKPLAMDMQKYVMVPKFAAARHVIVEKHLKDLAKFAETTKLNRIDKGKGKTGFITSGVSYLYIKDYYPDAPVLKLGLSYPLPEKKIRAFAKSVKEIFVIEELDPVLENQLLAMGIKIKVRHESFRLGELRPEYIPQIVAGKKKNDPPLPARKPSLCAGCSHHFVYHVLKKFDTFVSGDIGCYTLGALPPYLSVHSCICMGGGFTIAEGLKRGNLAGKKVVGVVGDSTFIHSGITGLINAAYNKSKGVLLILDNTITAMTGGQENPASGFTLKGEPAQMLDLAAICRACGADVVDVIDPTKHHDFEALLSKRLNENSLSVIIARSPCKLIKR